MPTESNVKAYFPVVYLFLGISISIFILQYIFPVAPVSYKVLHTGNTVLFLIGFISVRMSMKALTHKNVQVFLRLVYGSFMMKFFVLATVAFIYIFIYKNNINKPALFGCFGLYILYTFFEIRAVLKQSKNKNA